VSKRFLSLQFCNGYYFYAENGYNSKHSCCELSYTCSVLFRFSHYFCNCLNMRVLLFIFIVYFEMMLVFQCIGRFSVMLKRRIVPGKMLVISEFAVSAQIHFSIKLDT